MTRGATARLCGAVVGGGGMASRRCWMMCGCNDDDDEVDCGVTG